MKPDETVYEYQLFTRKAMKIHTVKMTKTLGRTKLFHDGLFLSFFQRAIVLHLTFHYLHRFF